MRSTTRWCSSSCERSRVRACALLALAWPWLSAQSARADDWLAMLPSCSSARAHPEQAPAFELVYPRAGLPALVAAGDRLIARAYVPAPLTPPPGVQQPRALSGWSAELIGHAPLAVAGPDGAPAAPQHRYPLEVVDVRPDGASSLLYRASIAIPAWAAPGTYDFVLGAPGGTGRARLAVRVLAAGATPRIAWLDDPERLADPSVAALPVDIWFHTPPAGSGSGSGSGPGSGSGSGSGLHFAPAPHLDVHVPALALRIGSALLVLGACESQPAAFAAEVASVLAREARTRMALPARAPPGMRQVWGAAPAAWPPSGSMQATRAADGVRVQVSETFPDTAELALLIAGDPERPLRISGAAAAPAFYPASEIAVPRVPARVLHLRVAPGAGAHIAEAAVRPAALAYALHAEPQPAHSGARVWLALVPKSGASAAGMRVAWRLDALRTAFGPARLEHRFVPLGAQRVQALALAGDGRAQRVTGDVRVQTARASGCSAAAASRARGAAWWPALALPALVLLQRRGRRKGRSLARSGIDCGRTPVCRELT